MALTLCNSLAAALSLSEGITGNTSATETRAQRQKNMRRAKAILETHFKSRRNREELQTLLDQLAADAQQGRAYMDWAQHKLAALTTDYCTGSPQKQKTPRSPKTPKRFSIGSRVKDVVSYMESRSRRSRSRPSSSARKSPPSRRLSPGSPGSPGGVVKKLFDGPLLPRPPSRPRSRAKVHRHHGAQSARRRHEAVLREELIRSSGKARATRRRPSR